MSVGGGGSGFEVYPVGSFHPFGGGLKLQELSKGAGNVKKIGTVNLNIRQQGAMGEMGAICNKLELDPMAAAMNAIAAYNESSSADDLSNVCSKLKEACELLTERADADSDLNPKVASHVYRTIATIGSIGETLLKETPSSEEAEKLDECASKALSKLLKIKTEIDMPVFKGGDAAQLARANPEIPIYHTFFGEEGKINMRKIELIGDGRNVFVYTDGVEAKDVSKFAAFAKEKIQEIVNWFKKTFGSAHHPTRSEVFAYEHLRKIQGDLPEETKEKFNNLIKALHEGGDLAPHPFESTATNQAVRNAFQDAGDLIASIQNSLQDMFPVPVSSPETKAAEAAQEPSEDEENQ
ncbi:MAG: hypothetical protein LBS68_03235 [Puniceicoccales bacterium]|nr:hypothetical protein [Puniceicoccales bacterium]